MSRESDIISTILTDLGWDENLAVPIANEENQKLLHLIDLKQKQTSTNKSDLDRINDKINAMSSHLKNCRQELQHSLHLKRAKHSENESENHLQKVEDREIGRLKQELEKMENKIRDIYQNKNIYENTLFKKTTELEELKQQMKWDQQALEAWLEESEKKGEDILSLQKYARQDESKIQELSLKLEHCTVTINEKRKQLEKEVVETKTTHVELEKTTDEFSNAHEERQKILSQWEATIDQLKRRDCEIDNLSAKLSLLKSEISRLQDNMKSKQEFFDNLVMSNEDIEKNIQLVERQTGRLRVEQKETEEQRASFQSELEALKRTCDRTASDLEQARVTISQLKKEKLDKEEKLERATILRKEMEEKLKLVTDEKMNAEEKANMADKMLEEEEMSHLRFETALKQTRDLQFKKAQELYDAQIEQKNINAEIGGNRSALKNLNTKILRLDHDLLKQQEILYTQEFAIQGLERRYNRMQGDHSNEEQEQLEAKISSLTETLDNVRRTVITLTSQTKRLQEELRRSKYDVDKVKQEFEGCTEKLEEVNLQNERSHQEMRRCRSEKEKVMVEANIMKLEVKRLRDRLYSKAEQVYTLDVRKQQLEQAVRERFTEIRIHKDMLTSQIRSADEEKSKINADLKARISKIDKLEKRYEILTISMAPPDGEEEQSQAFYVIKAAQDKEALQRQGDELDTKIRKTEKEIRGLENTLLLMNTCNHNYRKSLTRVTDVSEEMTTKKEMETQLHTVMDKYNFRKRQLMQIEEDYQMLKETFDNLNKDELLYREQVDGLLEQLMLKEKEKTKYEEKIERAENQISRLQHGILESNLAEEFQFIRDDVKLRERREFNRIAVSELQRHLQVQYPALINVAKQYLDSAGLAGMTPPVPLSPVSSTTISQGSSRRVSGRQSAISRPSPIPSSSSTSTTTTARSSTAGAPVKSPLNVIDMTSVLPDHSTIKPPSSASSKKSSKPPSVKSGSVRSSVSSSKASTVRSSKDSKGNRRG